MKKTQASQTAMGTAALRAIESEKPAAERICYDPIARKFINIWFYFPVKPLFDLANGEATWPWPGLGPTEF